MPDLCTRDYRGTRLRDLTASIVEYQHVAVLWQYKLSHNRYEPVFTTLVEKMPIENDLLANGKAEMSGEEEGNTLHGPSQELLLLLSFALPIETMRYHPPHPALSPSGGEETGEGADVSLYSLCKTQ